MRFFLLCLCLCCLGLACQEQETKTKEKPSEYLRVQKLAKLHQAEIFRLFENSSPEVKRQSREFVNLCIQNTEKEFLKKSGKGKDYLKKVINSIDFFVARIKEARAFTPTSEQIALYNKLRALLQRDEAVIRQYINDNNPKLNQTDKQRARTYQAILYNDFEGYRKKIFITEREFEENFNYLATNWEDLVLELYLHYGKKAPREK